ncbi:hypothetical protein U2T19_004858 [Salmonella enterica]|nr:hypothetical protein [Salmonella enterica]EMA3598516.1 hypothetical protein [Salmonella enterica]
MEEAAASVKATGEKEKPTIADAVAAGRVAEKAKEYAVKAREAAKNAAARAEEARKEVGSNGNSATAEAAMQAAKSAADAAEKIAAEVQVVAQTVADKADFYAHEEIIVTVNYDNFKSHAAEIENNILALQDNEGKFKIVGGKLEAQLRALADKLLKVQKLGDQAYHELDELIRSQQEKLAVVKAGKTQFAGIIEKTIKELNGKKAILEANEKELTESLTKIDTTLSEIDAALTQVTKVRNDIRDLLTKDWKSSDNNVHKAVELLEELKVNIDLAKSVGASENGKIIKNAENVYNNKLPEVYSEFIGDFVSQISRNLSDDHYYDEGFAKPHQDAKLFRDIINKAELAGLEIDNAKEVYARLKHQTDTREHLLFSSLEKLLLGLNNINTSKNINALKDIYRILQDGKNKNVNPVIYKEVFTKVTDKVAYLENKILKASPQILDPNADGKAFVAEFSKYPPLIEFLNAIPDKLRGAVGSEEYDKVIEKFTNLKVEISKNIDGLFSAYAKKMDISSELREITEARKKISPIDRNGNKVLITKTQELLEKAKLLDSFTKAIYLSQPQVNGEIDIKNAYKSKFDSLNELSPTVKVVLNEVTNVVESLSKNKSPELENVKYEYDEKNKTVYVTANNLVQGAKIYLQYPGTIGWAAAHTNPGATVKIKSGKLVAEFDVNAKFIRDDGEQGKGDYSLEQYLNGYMTATQKVEGFSESAKSELQKFVYTMPQVEKFNVFVHANEGGGSGKIYVYGLDGKLNGQHLQLATKKSVFLGIGTSYETVSSVPDAKVVNGIAIFEVKNGGIFSPKWWDDLSNVNKVYLKTIAKDGRYIDSEYSTAFAVINKDASVEVNKIKLDFDLYAKEVYQTEEQFSKYALTKHYGNLAHSNYQKLEEFRGKLAAFKSTESKLRATLASYKLPIYIVKDSGDIAILDNVQEQFDKVESSIKYIDKAVSDIYLTINSDDLLGINNLTNGLISKIKTVNFESNKSIFEVNEDIMNTYSKMLANADYVFEYTDFPILGRWISPQSKQNMQKFNQTTTYVYTFYNAALEYKVRELKAWSAEMQAEEKKSVIGEKDLKQYNDLKSFLIDEGKNIITFKKMHDQFSDWAQTFDDLPITNLIQKNLYILDMALAKAYATTIVNMKNMAAIDEQELIEKGKVNLQKATNLLSASLESKIKKLGDADLYISFYEAKGQVSLAENILIKSIKNIDDPDFIDIDNNNIALGDDNDGSDQIHLRSFEGLNASLDKTKLVEPNLELSNPKKDISFLTHANENIDLIQAARIDGKAPVYGSHQPEKLYETNSMMILGNSVIVNMSKTEMIKASEDCSQISKFLEMADSKLVTQDSIPTGPVQNSELLKAGELLHMSSQREISLDKLPDMKKHEDHQDSTVRNETADVSLHVEPPQIKDIADLDTVSGTQHF